MTAIRRQFRNQISTTIPQPYDPLNLGLPGTGQLSPIAYERLMMQGGRYLSGLGQNPDDGPEESPYEPTNYGLDDEPDWQDQLPYELQSDDDSTTSGIFDPDGTASTNVDMGVFADHWAIPGYIARNPPFYFNPEVQDVTADADVLEVPAGGMAYVERGGKNVSPMTSPWGSMSPYAYAPCPSQHHPRQPDSWAPPGGSSRPPMPMTPGGPYDGNGNGGGNGSWNGNGGIPKHLYVPGSNKPTEPYTPPPPPTIPTIPSALGPVPVRAPPRARPLGPRPVPRAPAADVRGFGEVPDVSSWDPTDVTPVPYRRARAPVPFRTNFNLTPFVSIVEPRDMTAPIYPGIGQDTPPAPAPAPTQQASAPSTGLGTYFVAGIVAGTAVALFASAMGGKKK